MIHSSQLRTQLCSFINNAVFIASYYDINPFYLSTYKYSYIRIHSYINKHIHTQIHILYIQIYAHTFRRAFKRMSDEARGFEFTFSKDF